MMDDSISPSQVNVTVLDYTDGETVIWEGVTDHIPPVGAGIVLATGDTIAKNDAYYRVRDVLYGFRRDEEGCGPALVILYVQAVEARAPGTIPPSMRNN